MSPDRRIPYRPDKLGPWERPILLFRNFLWKPKIAEINQPRIVFTNQEVLRFDISVNKSFWMEILQSFKDLESDQTGGLQGKSTITVVEETI